MLLSKLMTMTALLLEVELYSAQLALLKAKIALCSMGKRLKTMTMMPRGKYRTIRTLGSHRCIWLQLSRLCRSTLPTRSPITMSIAVTITLFTLDPSRGLVVCKNAATFLTKQLTMPFMFHLNIRVMEESGKRNAIRCRPSLPRTR